MLYRGHFRDIRAIRDGKAEKVRTLSDALNSVVAPILQRSRLPEGGVGMHLLA